MWYSGKLPSGMYVEMYSVAAFQILEILPLDGPGDVPVNIETRVSAGSYCVI